MRGEFDDQLQWPFRGTIAVQLVNQDGDKHYLRFIKFNRDVNNGADNRVTL